MNRVNSQCILPGILIKKMLITPISDGRWVRKLLLHQIANALQVTTDSILEFALEVKNPVLLAEYARVLERCSVQERRVLIEMTDMMIDIMRKNQASLNPKR